jgi:hypothetical protein
MLKNVVRAVHKHVAKMPDKFKSSSGWLIFAEAVEISHILKVVRESPLKYD